MIRLRWTPWLSRRLLAACLFAVSVVTCSCGGPPQGQVPVYRVRGRVLFKGKPVGNALVVFRPVGASNPKVGDTPQPTGRTDGDGRFELHTYLGNDGAPAGSYTVGISVAPAFNEARDVFKKALEKTRPKPERDLLGTRYADPAASGLKADVKPGENELRPFDLG